MKPRIFAAVFAVVFLTIPPAWCQSDWPMYGHDDGSTRYSPLKQVNISNVQNLTLAWTYHMKKEGPRPQKMGPAGRGGGRRLSEATPIMVNDTLYLPTPYSSIVALSPETGEEIWTYKLEKGRPASRGVSYWPGDKITPASILMWNQRWTAFISGRENRKAYSQLRHGWICRPKGGRGQRLSACAIRYELAAEYL